MTDTIEQMLKRLEEEGQIKCPHCEEVQENDDSQYPVSYHGEDEPTEWDCQFCDEKFFVKESVRRSYDVGKTVEDLDL